MAAEDGALGARCRELEGRCRALESRLGALQEMFEARGRALEEERARTAALRRAIESYMRGVLL